MADKLTEEQVSKALSILDEALSNGPWEETPFLAMIGKKLSALREEFLHGENNDGMSWAAQKLTNSIEQRANMTKVYVALYASNGGNLQSWERVITTLSSHLISRAIYANEEDIKAFIRSKPNPVNDGYVAIYIDPQDILTQPPEKIIKDKLGKPLLSLKNKAFSLDNLDVFVHQTGIFRWKNNRLIPNRD